MLPRWCHIELLVAWLLEVIFWQKSGSQWQIWNPCYVVSLQLPVRGLVTCRHNPDHIDSTWFLGIPQSQHGNWCPHLGTSLKIVVKNLFTKSGHGPACPTSPHFYARSINPIAFPFYHIPPVLPVTENRQHILAGLAQKYFQILKGRRMQP